MNQVWLNWKYIEYAVNNLRPFCLGLPISSRIKYSIRHYGLLWPWASFQIRNIVGCACTGNAGNVFPAAAGVRSRHASRHVFDARAVMHARIAKQRVLMHGHQGWNVRHGLCHIYMIYVYIWVVHSFCLFCCLFIIVTTRFVALYEPCKPKPKPKPSTYDTRTTTPWQRSKFRYLDRSQSNKYAINMQIQTISVSK